MEYEYGYGIWHTEINSRCLGHEILKMFKTKKFKSS